MPNINLEGFENLSISDKYMINPKKGEIYSVKRDKLLSPHKSDKRKNYLVVTIGDKTYNLHKLVYKQVHGDVPKGLVIDHIDHDIYNNSIDNLRCCTYSENNKTKNRDMKKICQCRYTEQYKIKSVDLDTKEEKIFPNKYQCAKGLNINAGMIFHVLSGLAKSAFSKDKQHRYSFIQMEANPNNFNELPDKLQCIIRSIRATIYRKFPNDEKTERIKKYIELTKNHKKLNDEEKEIVIKHFERDIIL